MFLRSAGNFNELMFPFTSLNKPLPAVTMMSCVSSSAFLDSVALFNNISKSVLKIYRNLLISFGDISISR